MKKSLAVLSLLALMLSACGPQESTEMQMRRTTAKLRIYKAQLEACEDNGGVKNITHGSNTTTVYCVNSVSTIAYN
jgi:hypothetical protein